uniref:Thyroid hormone responsive n=1 Tax=Aquila chrysaetos chrysaetos TaxID=223781 RepID=A0A663EPY0_AQUCH
SHPRPHPASRHPRWDTTQPCIPSEIFHTGGCHRRLRGAVADRRELLNVGGGFTSRARGSKEGGEATAPPPRRHCCPQRGAGSGPALLAPRERRGWRGQERRGPRPLRSWPPRSARRGDAAGPRPARAKAAGGWTGTDCGEPGPRRGRAPAGLEPSPAPRPSSPAPGWRERTAEEGRAPVPHKKPSAGPGSRRHPEKGAERRCRSRGSGAMEQYFSATRKMEREVMFPSLLRGVFPQQEGAAPATGGRADLYERYQLLKAIKPVVEKGLASVADQSPSGADADADADASSDAVDAQLEERLSHHLAGLQQVLTHLTRDANALTRRYSQILEQISPGEGQPSW